VLCCKVVPNVGGRREKISLFILGKKSVSVSGKGKTRGPARWESVGWGVSTQAIGKCGGHCRKARGRLEKRERKAVGYKVLVDGGNER